MCVDLLERSYEVDILADNGNLSDFCPIREKTEADIYRFILWLGVFAVIWHI